jgi:hypothetical protein
MNAVIFDWALKAYGFDVVEDMVGLIPSWVAGFEGAHPHTSDRTGRDCIDYLLQRYGMPTKPWVSSVVTENGNMESGDTEDPPLRPVALYTTRTTPGILQVYVYEYGIVGFRGVKEGLNEVYRFD